MLEVFATVLLAGMVLWLLAGELDLALKVYPQDAARLFRLDKDGCYRLLPDDVPGGPRHSYWMEAIDYMRQTGYVMDDIDQDAWILTNKGADLLLSRTDFC